MHIQLTVHLEYSDVKQISPIRFSLTQGNSVRVLAEVGVHINDYPAVLTRKNGSCCSGTLCLKDDQVIFQLKPRRIPALIEQATS